MPETVTLDAPAKVNLRLRVLAREASGYHALETIFCATSLTDTVSVRLGERGVRLAVEGEFADDAGLPEHNLVVRAAREFYAELRQDLRVDLRLHKRIPAGAGLGGGSSDAAATLRALNLLHGQPLPRESLLRLGSRLGSDVPFFLCGSPLALGWGRGENLLALPSLPRRPILIAQPRTPMPTREAFGVIAKTRSARGEPSPVILDWDSLARWEGLAEIAENDFEPVVAKKIGSVRDALTALRQAGAEIVLLAGSGSAVFGVFRERTAFEDLAHKLVSAGLWVWAGDTLEELFQPSLDERGATK